MSDILETIKVTVVDGKFKEIEQQVRQAVDDGAHSADRFLDLQRRLRQHPDVAKTMGLLATAIAATGDEASVEEARQLYTEALAIFEAALPAEHPHIVKTRTELAALNSTGDPAP